MIEVKELSKRFDGYPALNGLNLCVKKGSIYGLIGTNGSGKTTLIKHLTGIYRPDGGNVNIDGEPAYENSYIKQKTGYIPDDLSFYAPYSLKEMAGFYRSAYPRWDEERYAEMTKRFQLDEKRRISKLSKGMQKQAAFVLTMSSTPDYLILDEPIDGLDPLVRKLVWNYVVNDVADREMTVLVSSHNLREMEGICDSIGILNKGVMVIEQDLDELKSDIHKIQIAFPKDEETADTTDQPEGAEQAYPADPFENLNVLHRETRGSIELLIVRGSRSSVEEALCRRRPIIFDILPLSLEEIFIYELGGKNGEYQDILF